MGDSKMTLWSELTMLQSRELNRSCFNAACQAHETMSWRSNGRLWSEVDKENSNNCLNDPHFLLIYDYTLALPHLEANVLLSWISSIEICRSDSEQNLVSLAAQAALTPGWSD